MYYIYICTGKIYYKCLWLSFVMHPYNLCVTFNLGLNSSLRFGKSKHNTLVSEFLALSKDQIILNIRYAMCVMCILVDVMSLSKFRFHFYGKWFITLSNALPTFL